MHYCYLKMRKFAVFCLIITCLFMVKGTPAGGPDYTSGFAGALHSALGDNPNNIASQNAGAIETSSKPSSYGSSDLSASESQRRQYHMFGNEPARIGADSCPYGWTEYSGSCYLLGYEKMSWWHASMTCAKLGAHLACIDEAHENTYLRQLVKAIKCDRGVWMGLNDISNPGAEQWGWGLTQQPCTKYDWYGREPVTGTDYHCGILWEAYDYHWHVANCSQPNYFICEMKKGTPCTCQL